MLLAIFTQYGMNNVWDTVSAFIRLLMICLSMDFPFEKRTGQVTVDLLYIRLTC